MCSGKSTLSKALIAQRFSDGNTTVAMSLAKPIKDIAAALFPGPGKNRPLLVHIGRSMLELDNEVFLKAMERRLDKVLAEATEDILVTIDDVRFEHEVQWLRERGWFIVYCWCSQFERLRRHAKLYPDEPVTNEMATNPSEVGLDHLPASAFDTVFNTEISDPAYAAQTILLHLETRRLNEP